MGSYKRYLHLEISYSKDIFHSNQSKKKFDLPYCFHRDLFTVLYVNKSLFLSFEGKPILLGSPNRRSNIITS